MPKFSVSKTPDEDGFPEFSQYFRFIRNIGVLNVLLRGEWQVSPDGEVAERLKAHAWKACVGLNPTEGSNPSLSV